VSKDARLKQCGAPEGENGQWVTIERKIVNRKKFVVAILLPMLLSLSGASLAEKILREFHGTGNTVTAEFSVNGPWLLDWRLNGDYEYMIGIDITLLDGRTGRSIGQILRTKRRGNGVKLFEEGGRYKLRIDSTLAKWDLKVIQITAAEAELYTPRKNN